VKKEDATALPGLGAFIDIRVTSFAVGGESARGNEKQIKRINCIGYSQVTVLIYINMYTSLADQRRTKLCAQQCIIILL